MSSLSSTRAGLTEAWSPSPSSRMAVVTRPTVFSVAFCEGVGHIIGKYPPGLARANDGGSVGLGQDGSRDLVSVAVFTGFCATGTIGAGRAVAESEVDLGSPVEGMKTTHRLWAGGFHEVLGYFVASGCHVRRLKHLGSSRRRRCSAFIGEQRIRFLCPILEVHDCVLHSRRKPGSVPSSSSLSVRVPRVRLADVASMTMIELVATVPASSWV